MTMTATQPTQPQAGASDFFQEEERCQCLNDVCNATIPRSHVVSRIDPRTGRQEVKATCPYCRAVYEATRVLSDNRWKTVAFHMTPAEGFEPIGGTPRPTFDNGKGYTAPSSVVTDAERAALHEAPLVAHINEQFDRASAEAEGLATPEPSPMDAPAVEQLDTDCDAAAARADEGTPREPERTIDRSTSQLDHEDPERWDGLS